MADPVGTKQASHLTCS